MKTTTMNRPTAPGQEADIESQSADPMESLARVYQALGLTRRLAREAALADWDCLAEWPHPTKDS